MDSRGRSAVGHARTLAVTAIRRTGVGRKLLFAAAAASTGTLAVLAATAVVATQLLL